MSKRAFIRAVFLIMLGWAVPAVTSSPSAAATAAEIRSRAEQALTQLYNQDEAARQYGRQAKGILVFPNITKAGIGVGGSYGEGVLFVDGRPVDYYSIGSGSLGLTLGAQSFSQVIMFMTDEALRNFRASKGWEAGVDGSIVAIKEGAAVKEGTAASVGAAPSQDPVVGFILGQTGLMFDASFSGSKYTKIRR
jgi:lipid-binding SYLF domain-containing protein